MLGMRYGGDEFVIFGGFDKTEEQKVECLMQSIRDDIREVNTLGKYPFQVSMSMGTCCKRAQEVEDLGQLIEQADQMMYEEKRKKKKGKR